MLPLKQLNSFSQVVSAVTCVSAVQGRIMGLGYVCLAHTDSVLMHMQRTAYLYASGSLKKTGYEFL